MYPRTFAEFHRDHSGYIPALCAKLRWCSFGDVPDLVNEIYAEMMRKRTVESFDPSVYEQGASLRLFMAYIKLCATRIVQSLHTQRQSVTRVITDVAVSLSEPLAASEGPSTIMDTLGDDGRAKGQLEAKTQLDELTVYIDTNHPDLSVIMRAVREWGTLNITDLSEHLSGVMKPSTVSGRLTKLRKVLRNRRIS